MKRQLIFAYAVALSAAMLMAANPAPSANTVRNPDPAKRESWDAAVGDLRVASSALVRSLIAIANDPKLKNDDRIDAILLLGSIKDAEATDFLITNVTLRIEPKY